MDDIGDIIQDGLIASGYLLVLTIILYFTYQNRIKQERTASFYRVSFWVFAVLTVLVVVFTAYLYYLDLQGIAS